MSAVFKPGDRVVAPHTPNVGTVDSVTTHDYSWGQTATTVAVRWDGADWVSTFDSEQLRHATADDPAIAAVAWDGLLRRYRQLVGEP